MGWQGERGLYIYVGMAEDVRARSSCRVPKAQGSGWVSNGKAEKRRNKRSKQWEKRGGAADKECTCTEGQGRGRGLGVCLLGCSETSQITQTGREAQQAAGDSYGRNMGITKQSITIGVSIKSTTTK